MPVVNVAGIDINYQLEGDGAETVVLLADLADDLYAWDFQMPSLCDAGYRVLRFDNRGVGRTSKPTGPYTTQQLANDTKGLVDALGLERFHLLGLSMGGMIAQEFVLAHPENVKSVILACTCAESGPFCFRLFSLWADMAAAHGVPFVMRDAALWAFTPEFFDARPDEAAEFEAALAKIAQPVDAYLAQLHSIQQHNTSERLRGVSVPTLVLAGEQDNVVPLGLSRRLHELIPGAKWQTTRGGHACLWEYPYEFNAAIITFLGQHAT